MHNCPIVPFYLPDDQIYLHIHFRIHVLPQADDIELKTEIPVAFQYDLPNLHISVRFQEPLNAEILSNWIGRHYPVT
jgi:hypothetical protein